METLIALFSLENVITMVVALVLCAVVLKFIKGTVKGILLLVIGLACGWYLMNHNGINILSNIFVQLETLIK